MSRASLSPQKSVAVRPSCALISTLVVDDNPAFLEAAVRFLCTNGRTTLVGSAESGEEALLLAARLRPQLVVMDLMMPGLGGLEATRRLKSGPDPPRIIVLTLHNDDEMRGAAYAAQADGFLGKSEMSSHLPALIEALFNRPM